MTPLAQATSPYRYIELTTIFTVDLLHHFAHSLPHYQTATLSLTPTAPGKGGEKEGEGERGETLPLGVRRSLEVRVLVLIDRV
eukprot:COSAG06_NODE_1069_length_10828_cov_22.835493_10_plen_83_part_00